MRNLLLLPVLVTMLPGCFAGLAFSRQGSPIGLIYTDAGVASHPTNNDVGRKKGEACATSIFGLVTTGDAGIKTAAEAAGITQIAAIDYYHTNILGIYSKFCTIVSGDAGAGE